MASYSDVNGDGILDLVLQFSIDALQLTTTSTKASLVGKLIGGAVIKGSDSVRIIP